MAAIEYRDFEQEIPKEKRITEMQKKKSVDGIFEEYMTKRYRKIGKF